MSGNIVPGRTIIRPLQADDALIYRDIRLEGLRLHPEAFISSYEEEAALTDQQFVARMPALPDVILGAFLGGSESLVGVAGFHVETKQKQIHRATVWGMYVRSAARGQGVAAALLDGIVRHARALGGIETVHLTVESNNQAARSVYQKAGFLPYGIDRGAVKLGPGQYFHAEMRVLKLAGEL